LTQQLTLAIVFAKDGIKGIITIIVE